nr:glycosyltransferase family 2 protein [Hyphomonas sediminis]
MAPTLCVVVPCYNEKEVLAESAARLTSALESLVSANLVHANSFILFVDDGSKDETWALIEGVASRFERAEGLKLSRNRGHQNAVFAGLMEASADVFVSIDADLQDDISVIEKMVREHIDNKVDIVYGVRADRSSDTRFKRFTAEAYYRILSVMGVEVVFNHADFRLMSARTVRALGSYREVHLFLRGLVPLIGFKTATVEYDRSERFAGESKYPLRKMLSLAWEGITSFSARPLRMIFLAGASVSFLSFIAAIVAIFASISGATIAGWTSIMVMVAFLGGIQLLSIGLIGEYIGKIYIEIKDRPRYFVDVRTRP